MKLMMKNILMFYVPVTKLQYKTGLNPFHYL